jgi:hypothetical protein
VRKIARLEDVKPHDLRHSFAKRGRPGGQSLAVSALRVRFESGSGNLHFFLGQFWLASHRPRPPAGRGW